MRALILASLLLSACVSDEDNYCQNIADCTYGGSADWVTACQQNVSGALTEAAQINCTTQFDAYYACTSNNFQCNGNTSSFPGCDSAFAVLNACIAMAESQPDSGATWCARLALATAQCTDASAPNEGCSAARDCEAQCFLTNVQNPCAPDINGLDAYTQCAASCPAPPADAGGG